MLSVLEAAELMARVYGGDGLGPDETILDDETVQGSLMTDERALVIQGTNQHADWVLHNFNLFGWRHPLQELHGERFHAGFYDYAMRVVEFARPKVDAFDVVVGHSLGGAAAQITGAVLHKPTIAFGSPKPWRRRNWRRDKSTMKRDHLHVVNRTDDRVPNVPPGPMGGFLPVPYFDFAQMGTVHALSPPLPNFGEDHRIDNYIELLKLEVFEELAKTPVDALTPSRWVQT